MCRPFPFLRDGSGWKRTAFGGWQAGVIWMGFSGGPGGARIVASLVQGHQPPVDFDLTAFVP